MGTFCIYECITSAYMLCSSVSNFLIQCKTVKLHLDFQPIFFQGNLGNLVCRSGLRLCAINSESSRGHFLQSSTKMKRLRDLHAFANKKTTKSHCLRFCLFISPDASGSLQKRKWQVSLLIVNLQISCNHRSATRGTVKEMFLFH